MIPLAAAQSNEISVLSVTNESIGGVADIYLEIRPGHNSLFLDSFPLTKLDTQISTRFAREYACKLVDKDCTSLDFFYVIRASSTIIGGPSAGAAITVLTYATLEDLELDDNTIMTGTIDSGGLIGPVGSIPEKVGAAMSAGFERVLVPAIEYDTNLSEYKIEVIPVIDIEEAIEYFTGRHIKPPYSEIQVPDEYFSTMEIVADSLCRTAKSLSEMAMNESAPADRFMSKATEALGRTDYYSAASYCFAASLELRKLELSKKSQAELRRIYRQLEVDIESLDRSLPKDIDNIADLEIYMIVRERLIDAYDTLHEETYENITPEGLGYAVERYNSAFTWSSFFGAIPSEPFDLSEEHLHKSCRTKLAEAEERLNYISYLINANLADVRQELNNAYEDLRQKEYALCVFKASKAKAEADSVISAVYAGDNLNSSVRHKIEKAGEVIGRQTAKGSFPILSYSYYEYAQNLNDTYSSNLYAEYALELATLDIYLPERKAKPVYDLTKIALFFAGLLIGVILGVLSLEFYQYRKKRRKHRR